MPLDIPGYYYNEETGKYYKIEKAQTAPSQAAWSTEQVKVRKQAKRIKRAEEERARLLKNHIKRHAALARDVVAGSVLNRELGVAGGYYDDAAATCGAWASGIRNKGSINFAPSFARRQFSNLPCFWVGGEDDLKTGMGVAYATLDEETLVGTYIETDENDDVRVVKDSNRDRTRHLRTEMVRCPQMSSIKYHKPSHRMLLTSREPDHSCGLYFFSPPVTTTDDPRPQWLLGETNHYQRLSIRHRRRDEWLVHQSTPAPASSSLLCVIGTNAGILRVHSNETIATISAQGSQSSENRQHQPREIFDQDFQMGNHNVLLAGGRQPRLWMTDMRESEADWTFIRHSSSITHLRSVNEHQVLVAGLQDQMCLYDLRFFAKTHRPNGHKPLVTFPGYKNQAHVHTGWDVSTDLGVVAAAHDDGTVKLFSLQTGRALRSPELTSVKVDSPIKALMFQRMLRERMSSLWVGEGPSLKKFSFGAQDLYDEV